MAPQCWYRETANFRLRNLWHFATLTAAFAAVLFSGMSARAGQSGLQAAVDTLQAKDDQGRSVTSASLRGKPVALFFFCGCDKCHAVASALARVLAADPPAGPLRQAILLVDFFDEAEGAHRFLAETGMDSARPTVLPDPRLELAGRLQTHACPRAFVLDSAGRLRHATVDPDEKAPAPEPAAFIATLAKALTQTEPKSQAISAPVAAAATAVHALPLSIAAGQSMREVAPGRAEYSFGLVGDGGQPTAQHRFQIENRNREPVNILRLRGSCGCQTLRLIKDGTETPSISLAPGERATIEVNVRLAGLRGSFHKMVWAYGASTEPLLTVEYTGTAWEPVSFQPAAIAFATGIGAPTAQLLTVTVDSALATARALPELKSNVAGVVAAPEGVPVSEVVQGKPVVRQRYRVTHDSAATGPARSGTLSFANSDGGRLSGYSVPVRVGVTGAPGASESAVMAVPVAVQFGVIPAGGPAKRQTILLGSKAEIESLSASSEEKALRVTLGPATPTGSADGRYARSLDITLDAGPAGGPIDAIVMVKLGGGRSLLVPVRASFARRMP